MRALPAEIAAALSNPGIKVRQLLWITARNRGSGNPESIGIWTGEDVQNFTIGGVARTYYGGGSFISAGDMLSEVGLNVRRLSVSMSPITPEIEQVLRGYDAKMAPVELHLAFFSTETNNLVAPPYRIFKGWIDRFPITTPALNGQGEARLDLVSSARILTNGLALKRSNDSQNRRQSGDAFFRDVSISGQIQTPWGSKTINPPGVSGYSSVVRRLTQLRNNFA